MSKVEISVYGFSNVAITDTDDVTRYFNEFVQLHREVDLPAEINPNHKTFFYYRNGLLHNENVPACHYVENGKVRDEYF